MRIFSAVKTIEKQIKSKCLSCEGEVITYLLENGPSRPREIIENCIHSPVSIFSKLKILSESGVIVRQYDNRERQVIYYIHQNALDALFDHIGDWGMHIGPIEQTAGMESQ